MANETTYYSVSAEHIRPAPITVKQLREAVFGKMLTSGPGTNPTYMPTETELDNILEGLTSAVTKGQVIDFGMWPNEFIQITAKRAGPMYSKSALGHPFETSWVFLHAWNDDELMSEFSVPPQKAYAAYLICPIPAEETGTLACSFEAVELNGMNVTVNNEVVFLLGIGDRVILYPGIHPNPDYTGYSCEIVAAYKRFLDTPMWEAFQHLTDEQCACNVIDPVMTALLMLNTNGIKTETIVAPPKLNRARIKARKYPIPPYKKVTSDLYVTTILARRTRNIPAAQGSHASPIAHIRKGHWRNYAPGLKTYIRDTLVNVDEAARLNFVAHRSHYNVKPE